jgi:hypothetical protein
VQQRRRLDRLQQILVAHADLSREIRGLRLNAANVTVRHLILGVDRHGERLDRRQVQAIQLLDVFVRVVDPIHGRFEREVQNQQQRDDDAYVIKIDLAVIPDEEERN